MVVPSTTAIWVKPTTELSKPFLCTPTIPVDSLQEVGHQVLMHQAGLPWWPAQLLWPVQTDPPGTLHRRVQQYGI